MSFPLPTCFSLHLPHFSSSQLHLSASPGPNLKVTVDLPLKHIVLLLPRPPDVSRTRSATPSPTPLPLTWGNGTPPCWSLASPPCLLLPRTRRESTCFLIPAPRILSPSVANDKDPMRVEELGTRALRWVKADKSFYLEKIRRWRYFVMVFIRIPQGNMKKKL